MIVTLADTGVYGMRVATPEYKLAVQLGRSLEALKTHLGLELVLHRGVHDVVYKRSHTIKVVWHPHINHFLVTSSSLVPIGVNGDSTISLASVFDVVTWLFNNGRF